MEKREVLKKGKEILEAFGGVLNRNNKKRVIVKKTSCQPKRLYLFTVPSSLSMFNAPK